MAKPYQLWLFLLSKKTTMQRTLFLLILLFSFRTANAQQTHFIYIQTENKQPFYIRQDKKIFSSSVSGYLIIPKLTDGDYDFQIGFPKGLAPEQDIHFTINKKDLGYLLKNFGEKGWGFYNLQNMDVHMATRKVSDINESTREYKTDAFSNVLSNVVNDPSLRIKDPEPVKIDTAVAIVPEKKEEPIVVPVATVAKRSQISTLLKTVSKEGAEMIYVDLNGSIADTIRVFIPIAEPVAVAQPNLVTEPIAKVAKKEKRADPISGIRPKQVKPVKKEDKKFIDIELPNPNSKDSIRTISEVQNKPDTAFKVILPNTDCKSVAVEDDFLKLRKKMAAADNDNEMLSVARKTFKTKCFTTEQIKNLSVLFLKDNAKYQFFEMAYPFASDSYNYPTLQAQLTEDYFISQFKKLVSH